MKKIYLSPSDQVRNIYAYGNTNEAAQCRKIAAACKTALERSGFAVRTNFEDGTNAMYTRVAESNTWGADLHLCIHTNAGGGKGAEAYVIDKTAKRLAAAQPIYDEVRAIAPYGSSRGVKTARFYELRYTTGTCVYLEVDFHDNAEIAKWIVNNTTAIGEAIAKGVCRAFGASYVSGSGATAAKPEAGPAVQTIKVTLDQLERGSRGTQVKTLQRLLKQLGYKDSAGKVLAIDGSFGPATDYALRKFQKKSGVSVDGIVGTKTWAKLLK